MSNLCMTLFVKHNEIFDIITSAQFLSFHMMNLHLGFTINDLVAHQTNKARSFQDFLLLPSPLNCKQRVLLTTFLEVLPILFLKRVLIQHQLVTSNLYPFCTLFEVEDFYFQATFCCCMEHPISSPHCLKICLPNCFLTFALSFLTSLLLGPIPQFSPLIPIQAFEDFAGYHAIMIVAPPAQDGIQFHNKKVSGEVPSLLKQVFETFLYFFNGIFAAFDQHFEAACIAGSRIQFKIVSKEVKSVFDIGNESFVRMQEQATFPKEFLNSRFDSVCQQPRGCACDYKIVGILYCCYFWSPFFVFTVEPYGIQDTLFLTIKTHICNDGRNSSPLWNTGFTIPKFPFFKDSRFQPFLEYVGIHWNMSKDPLMIQVIKEPQNISFQYPKRAKVLSQSKVLSLHGIFCRTARTVSIGVALPGAFCNRQQCKRPYCLNGHTLLEFPRGVSSRWVQGSRHVVLVVLCIHSTLACTVSWSYPCVAGDHSRLDCPLRACFCPGWSSLS